MSQRRGRSTQSGSTVSEEMGQEKVRTLWLGQEMAAQPAGFGVAARRRSRRVRGRRVSRTRPASTYLTTGRFAAFQAARPPFMLRTFV